MVPPTSITLYRPFREFSLRIHISARNKKNIILCTEKDKTRLLKCLYLKTSTWRSTRRPRHTLIYEQHSPSRSSNPKDFLFLSLNFSIYFWKWERQSTNRGGTERGGDTEPEAGSRLWAVSTEPNMGLELTNDKIMAWAEGGHSTKWATQVLL